MKVSFPMRLLGLQGTPLLISFVMAFSLVKVQAGELFIDAENFDHKGGWVVDPQFMDQMGSSYLMAHGMGAPVEDARTVVDFPSPGEYVVFVRTFNWTSPWYEGEGPGRFQLLVDGTAVGLPLGTTGKRWHWQRAGEVSIQETRVELSLRDLTGFNGRCDAIYFTRRDKPPPDDLVALSRFRRRQPGMPGKPEKAGNFDLVVVGGGIAGSAAAVTAARLGLQVALIQDRPVLGGNNSSEIRVGSTGLLKQEPYPALGDVVKLLVPSQPPGNALPPERYEDEKILAVVMAEPNISLFMNHRAFAVDMRGNRIRSVTARHTKTGQELSFTAKLFADCTGDGTIGYLAGADYRMGRESRYEFGEKRAPEIADKQTMGSSVLWYSTEEETPVPFPVFQYGLNFSDETVEKIRKSFWYWEVGFDLDQIKDAEKVRDYALLVILSNWSYLKNFSSVKEEYANSRLDWVGYVAGKRESRRLLGDMILKEQDVVDQVIYPDASVATTWTIDLHYPHPRNTEHFPGQEFISIARHEAIDPYPIPYRCFFSRNVENLFMAGRNISVTHIALGTIRVQNTTGMMGEVVGMAAAVCKHHNTTPRGVYTDHLASLIALMQIGAGRPWEQTEEYNLGVINRSRTPRNSK